MTQPRGMAATKTKTSPSRWILTTTMNKMMPSITCPKTSRSPSPSSLPCTTEKIRYMTPLRRSWNTQLSPQPWPPLSQLTRRVSSQQLHSMACLPISLSLSLTPLHTHSKVSSRLQTHLPSPMSTQSSRHRRRHTVHQKTHQSRGRHGTRLISLRQLHRHRSRPMCQSRVVHRTGSSIVGCESCFLACIPLEVHSPLYGSRCNRV